MTLQIFIDNNAWDVFFEESIDLVMELPSPDFSLHITREAEFEIPSMPQPKREYVERILKSGKIHTDKFFGFFDASLAPEVQRVGGFGDLNDPNVGGRFIEKTESDLIQSESASVGPGWRPTGLLKNEADVSLAARSLHSVVLTCDGKKALKRAKNHHGGHVVDLKKYQKGSSLADFIKSEASALIECT